MNIIEIILVALSLSMDAFSISIILGLKNNTIKEGIVTSFSFGLFQFIMPIIGFYLGYILSNQIINYHTYFSSLILIILGIIMLTDKSNSQQNQISFKKIILLSIATSIDAFVIGISFSFVKTRIIIASIIIGITTFIMCSIGYFLGHLFNKKTRQYANIIGGITLIILGVRNLIAM